MLIEEEKNAVEEENKVEVDQVQVFQMQIPNLILNANPGIILDQVQNLSEEVAEDSEEDFLRHGLDEEKGESVPFILNVRANYVGKNSSTLDSPRKLEDVNLGAPNYWTFAKLNEELASLKQQLHDTKTHLEFLLSQPEVQEEAKNLPNSALAQV